MAASPKQYRCRIHISLRNGPLKNSVVNRNMCRVARINFLHVLLIFSMLLTDVLNLDFS